MTYLLLAVGVVLLVALALWFVVRPQGSDFYFPFRRN